MKKMEAKEIIVRLELLKNPENVAGMARFGIRPKTKVYGIAIPELRKMAKQIGKDHALAMELWDLKIHEARLLAGLIADPKKLAKKQFEVWVKDFDSWDICDQVCYNLFNKTAFVYEKIFEFAKRKAEFEKRTAFALIAALAVHDKTLKDEVFLSFFPLISAAASDERNFVKKAVNWALRQIGKRNKKLHAGALTLAQDILEIPNRSAQWIAKDAIRELRSTAVQGKIHD